MHYFQSIAILMLFTMFGCSSNSTSKPKSDSELLQGTWIVTQADGKGLGEHGEPFGSARFVFTDETLTAPELGNVRFRITIRPDKDPKEIDLTPLDYAGGKPIRGIYWLPGDNALTMSWATHLTLNGRDQTFKQIAKDDNDYERPLQFGINDRSVLLRLKRPPK